MIILGGIIDSDYTDEIKILCFNLMDNDIILKKRTRLAQIIFIPCLTIKEWKETKKPIINPRTGFGSTDHGTKDMKLIT